MKTQEPNSKIKNNTNIHSRKKVRINEELLPFELKYFYFYLNNKKLRIDIKNINERGIKIKMYISLKKIRNMKSIKIYSFFYDIVLFGEFIYKSEISDNILYAGLKIIKRKSKAIDTLLDLLKKNNIFYKELKWKTQ